MLESIKFTKRLFKISSLHAKYDGGSLFYELNSPQLKDFRQKHLYVENAK